MGSRMVTRLMTSRDHKGKERDPDIFQASYLDNRSRLIHGYNRTPIGKRTWRVEWPRDR